ncbi:MAG: AI-2E family transporter YdiK [Rubrivivax sp.]|nr:AI-2E family transporter YdiK [Rubrivivax sp.]
MRPQADLARTTFAVLFIGVLLAAVLWILAPFVGPAIWAVMVVVATWSVMLRVQAMLWGRRGLAVLVMTLLLLLLLVVPLTLAIFTIVGNADRLLEWARLATTFHLPDAPPQWIVNLPLVGGFITGLWEQGTALGLRDLMAKVTPYAGNVTRWFVGQVGNVGFLLLQFLVTVVIAAVLYGTGEEAVALVRRFAARLGGERGVAVVALAGGAIRGVALGVGVTALVQAVLSGGALALAGVPFAGLLTAVTFMLCIAQLGPVLVLVPAAVWAFWSGQTGEGIALILWTLFVANFDNVLRPLLIRMGADLPLLLIFAGVIGGLLSFGMVGIFVGPVVLAVAWTLLQAWVDDGDRAPIEYRD